MRRLKGLARLLEDVRKIRGELEGSRARTIPGLSTFYERESRMQLAGPEFSGPRPANGGGDGQKERWH
jgi:hypothetical protein